MTTPLTQKQKVALLEALGRTVDEHWNECVTNVFRLRLGANATSQGFHGGFEEHESQIPSLIAECQKLLVEGDIALKLLEVFLTENPIELSNEFRRKLVVIALQIKVNPQDLLDMIRRRAAVREAEVFKDYSPAEIPSESRPGERRKRS